ncbi:hypothetical protein HBB16_20030 [Pseudonocardia sp. MCCB 268]|nr:hypothetical protein [Pseudonocardia cytotoxica]
MSPLRLTPATAGGAGGTRARYPRRRGPAMTVMPAAHIAVPATADRGTNQRRPGPGIDRPDTVPDDPGEDRPTPLAVQRMTDIVHLFTGRDGTAVTAYRCAPDGPRGIRRRTAWASTPCGNIALAGAPYRARFRRLRPGTIAGTAPPRAAREPMACSATTGWGQLVADVGVLSGLASSRALRARCAPRAQHGVVRRPAALATWTPPDAVVLSGTAALDVMEQGLTCPGRWTLSSFNERFEQRTGSRPPAIPPRSTRTSPTHAAGSASTCPSWCDVRRRPAAGRGRDAEADPDRPPWSIVVGTRDLGERGLQLVGPLTERYAAAGLEDVSLRIWPGARHEVFNDQPGRGRRRPAGLAGPGRAGGERLMRVDTTGRSPPTRWRPRRPRSRPRRTDTTPFGPETAHRRVCRTDSPPALTSRIRLQSASRWPSPAIPMTLAYQANDVQLISGGRRSARYRLAGARAITSGGSGMPEPPGRLDGGLCPGTARDPGRVILVSGSATGSSTAHADDRIPFSAGGRIRTDRRRSCWRRSQSG